MFFRSFVLFFPAFLLVTTMGCSEGSPEAEREISLGRLRLKTFGLQADVRSRVRRPLAGPLQS